MYITYDEDYTHEYDQRAQDEILDEIKTKDCRRAAHHKHSKHHTLAHYDHKDLATACGISTKTLERYCKAHNINLKKIPLLQLSDIIQEFKVSSTSPSKISDGDVVSDLEPKPF